MSERVKNPFKKPSMSGARKRIRTAERILFDMPSSSQRPGAGLNYHIKTFGCQANEADSEAIKGILETLGYRETCNEADADFLLLNTCAVRKSAEDRAFGEIGRLKGLKRTRADMLFAVAGCMPQEENVVETLLQRHPHVDIVFGTHNIHKLPDYIETAIYSRERVLEVYSGEGDIIENMPRKRAFAHKAFVNIMHGCDEFCAYCIVPYTRGRKRSRSEEDILTDIETLKADGVKEVTLLGQNVNAYGRDLEHGARFDTLLESVAKTGIDRVRFMTSHPNDFDERTLEVIAKHRNIMPHIHLPVQSGSTRILKDMNRKYTREDYIALVDSIHRIMPDVSLTSDIIVGYPSESDADFEATLSLVERCKLEGAFTFVYSPREGTPAATREDRVDDAVKKARLRILNEHVNAAYKSGHERFLGKTLDVLVDGVSRKDAAVVSGYTPHHKLVHVEAPAAKAGDIIRVKITEAKTWTLEGELDGSA